MEKSITQVEKNTSASFGYVKKDMLMLNDAFSDLHDKMQHLSLNHAMLLEEIGKLRKDVAILSGKEKSSRVLIKKISKKNPKKKKAPKKKRVAPVKKKPVAVKKVVKETVTYE